MTGRSTVLVVDDTPAHRYVMASWLRRAGYVVVEASTGFEALRLAGGHLDAIILDVNLPDIPGPQVCRRLKSDPATEHVPVLHVSATSIDTQSRTAGLEQGADAYLVEPLDEGEFLATVRALGRTRAAHRGVGRTVSRMERLTEALVPLHQARSYEQVVDAAARGASAVLGRAVIAMVVVDQTHVLRTLCSNGEPLVRARGEKPISDVEPNKPVVIALRHVPPPWHVLLAQSTVPPGDWYTTMLANTEGMLIGGLGVWQGLQAPLTDEDTSVIQRFTEAMTVALSNLRSFAEEHRIALALQRAMLPQQLPEDDGLDIAVRYRASEAMLAVGGDFYDAFALDDGRTALVIGDVQGHSLRAATVMGELRISLRAYLREGHSPAKALDLLNDLLRDEHPEFVTVCVVVVDPATRVVETVNAGHLPPLVVDTEGKARFLRGTSRILGMALDEPRISHRHELERGETLVLVTDGLVERRGISLRTTLEQLADVAADAAAATPDELADELLRTFADGQEDDIAVLVARRPLPTITEVQEAGAVPAAAGSLPV